MNRWERFAVFRRVGRPAPSVRAHAWVALTTAAVAAAFFVACGGSSHPASAPGTTAASTSSTTPAFRDVVPTAADFVSLNSMTPVGDHFLNSLNGHLDAVLAVAHSKNGGVYPVGTVIQLFPTEAMVKRHAGYNPSTGDWEFFRLNVSPQGTRIVSSGAVVKNFLGADCASCHDAAAKFDFVCGTNHGCAPLGITDAQIAGIQRSDPRPKR
jgi:hypothetical protein